MNIARLSFFLFILFSIYFSSLSLYLHASQKFDDEELRNYKSTPPTKTLIHCDKVILKNLLKFLSPEDWINLSVTCTVIKKRIFKALELNETGREYYLSRTHYILNYKPKVIEPPGWGESIRAAIAMRYLHYAVLCGARPVGVYEHSMISYMQYLENFRYNSTFKRKMGTERLNKIYAKIPSFNTNIYKPSRLKNFMKYELGPYLFVAAPIAIIGSLFYSPPTIARALIAAIIMPLASENDKGNSHNSDIRTEENTSIKNSLNVTLAFATGYSHFLFGRWFYWKNLQ